MNLNPEITREGAINDIVRFLKEQKSEEEIKIYLTSLGVSERDLGMLIAEAKDSMRNDLKRRIIWCTLTVFAFILFYFLIPTNIYNAAPFIISLVGAVLFTVCLGQAIGNFRNWEDFNSKNKKDWRNRYIPLVVIPGIAMIFVFVMHFSSNEKSELKKYGQLTTGIIVDGSAIKNRRGAMYDLTVRYQTKEGRTCIVKESVDETEFRKIHKGEEVELIYSTKDPTMIQLLISDDVIQSYTGSEERELIVKDLIDLLNTDDKQIKNYLNKIMYGWNYNQNDSIWVNERKGSVIKIYLNKEIRCLTFGMSAFQFSNQFKTMGFTITPNENKEIVFFQSDHYFASVKRTFGNNNMLGTITTIQKK